MHGVLTTGLPGISPNQSFLKTNRGKGKNKKNKKKKKKKKLIEVSRASLVAQW